MKEEDKNKVTVIESGSLNKIQQADERQSVLSFIKKIADDNADNADKKKQAREREIFELMGGGTSSIYNQNKIISQSPVDHEPKFTGFFINLGRIAQWTPEQIRTYRKPILGAKTINQTVYSRFGKDIFQYIQEKNPYVNYCTRRYKHYKFLNENGIILLEGFIKDALQAINESTTVHEFRVKMFTQHGVNYQMDIFERNSQ